jgi:hypothetical protein
VALGLDIHKPIEDLNVIIIIINNSETIVEESRHLKVML